ncbi:hypothetical protein D8M38_12695, partial [Kocuria sp. HSID17582]
MGLDRAVGLDRVEHHRDAAGPVAAGSATGASAAQDVHDLAVTGWLALTGRYPGPDSHRVPLSLMCPTAPRHLVLMLEAALCDDHGQRPSAHELAAGFDAPVRRPSPARRPPERMTPEVIRADGTVVKQRRRLRLAAGLQLPGGRERGTGKDRTSPAGSVAGRTVAVEGQGPGRRRVFALAAAVLAAAALVWAFVGWSHGDIQAGTEATASSEPGGAAGGQAAKTLPSATGEAAADPGRAASREGDPDSNGSPRAASPTASAGSTAGAAPGESMQDKDREAREA